jgi:hypothetical protein
MIRLMSAIFVAYGIAWQSAGKDRKQEDFRSGEVIAHLQNDSTDALPNFGGRGYACVVGSVRVVGADHQLNRLRLKSLALAALQTSQDSLGCIAKLAVLMPTKYLSNIALLASLHPPVGSRVSVQEEIDGAFLCDLGSLRGGAPFIAWSACT